MKGVLKFFSIVFAVVVLDALTKGALLYLITGGVPLTGAAFEMVPFPYLMTRVTNFFNVVFTWNPGTSFSMFRALGESLPIVLIIFAGFIAGFIGHYALTRAKKWEQVPLALIVGGAVGNLLDRVRFGAVVDFLDFHLGEYHWPAFNVADICICLGVGLYILNWFLECRKLSKDGK